MAASLESMLEQKLDISNDYPFLSDSNSIEFIKNAKIMFINRGTLLLITKRRISFPMLFFAAKFQGLPGSGKSTLSKKIVSIYGEEKTVVCSGDDYFTDKLTGVYTFEQNKLEDAHLTARLKAEKSCG